MSSSWESMAPRDMLMSASDDVHREIDISALEYVCIYDRSKTSIIPQYRFNRSWLLSSCRSVQAPTRSKGWTLRTAAWPGMTRSP